MTTKGKLIVVGVAVVALGVVFVSGGLGSDLASSAIRKVRMRVVLPPTTALEVTTARCQNDAPITREDIVAQSKLHMPDFGGKLNPTLHPFDVLTSEIVELLKKEIIAQRSQENCNEQPITSEEITTFFSVPTSEEITTSAPQQTTCNESEINRITQEVNALKGQEYLEAVIQEIAPNDSRLRSLGTAALRQYIIGNIAYFKARLIQIRLSKICPEKNQDTGKNEDMAANISTTQSTQECVNSCVNSCF